MKIRFTKSGGFSGIRTEFVFDLEDLPGVVGDKVKSLVEYTAFFDLPVECLSPSCDSFQYTLTIESEGRRHVVHTDELGCPDRLWPLIEHLIELTREKKSAFSKPGNPPGAHSGKEKK